MENLTIGQYLKKSREEKNISRQQASDKTRINLRILTNIEADNFSKLPKLIYLKGFVRNVSRILDIDQEFSVSLLVESYEKYHGKNKLNTYTSPKKNKYSTITENFDLAINLSKYVLRMKIFRVFSFFSIIIFTFFYLQNVLEKESPGLSPSKIFTEKKLPLFLPPKELIEKKTSLSRTLIPKADNEVSKLIVKVTEGQCWIAYKIDQQPIRNLNLSINNKLILEGKKIRLVLGKPEVVKIDYNGAPLELKPFISNSGTASLIFPQHLIEKYPTPFFVFNNDGTAFTLNEIKKKELN